MYVSWFLKLIGMRGFERMRGDEEKLSGNKYLMLVYILFSEPERTDVIGFKQL